MLGANGLVGLLPEHTNARDHEGGRSALLTSREARRRGRPDVTRSGLNSNRPYNGLRGSAVGDSFPHFHFATIFTFHIITNPQHPVSCGTSHNVRSESRIHSDLGFHLTWRQKMLHTDSGQHRISTRAALGIWLCGGCIGWGLIATCILLLV